MSSITVSNRQIAEAARDALDPDLIVQYYCSSNNRACQGAATGLVYPRDHTQTGHDRIPSMPNTALLA